MSATLVAFGGFMLLVIGLGLLESGSRLMDNDLVAISIVLFSVGFEVCMFGWMDCNLLQSLFVQAGLVIFLAGIFGVTKLIDWLVVKIKQRNISKPRSLT